MFDVFKKLTMTFLLFGFLQIYAQKLFKTNLVINSVMKKITLFRCRFLRSFNKNLKNESCVIAMHKA